MRFILNLIALIEFLLYFGKLEDRDADDVREEEQRSRRVQPCHRPTRSHSVDDVQDKET
jgi:hypothetical protein